MRVIAVPRELKPTSPTFLRGHYSTGVREAAAMAVYAASVGSDPRAVQNGGRPRWGGPGGSHGRGRPPQSTEYRSGQATGRAGGCNSL